MQKLACHHGHRFDAPSDADRGVICPLCGAVTKSQGKVETKGHSGFDRTLDIPSSGEFADSASGSLNRTLDIDESSVTDGELLQTASYEDPLDKDADKPDTKLHKPSAKTIAFGKTLKLAHRPLPNGEVQSEAISPPPAANGLPEDADTDNTDDSPHLAKTVALGKTVSFESPPPRQNSNEDSDIASTTIDGMSGPTLSGRQLAPTALLRTLDAQSVPVDKGSVQPPPQTPSTASGVKPPDLPGYTVLNELGRGGMGVVYRARHEKRNREVALKTLLHISPVELQRFKQEFRSLADIAHPNLAGLYDLLSDGETWCFSMEILEAVDFTEYVWSGFDALNRQKGQRLIGASSSGAPRLTNEIKERLYEGLKQLVLGLNTLHQAGMLHRDIKPSNVLVTTEGRVVLVDFGLASQFEEGSDDRPVGIQGTPEYMAPEQAACNPLSPASDWYAVGVMIYEVLTGYFPISGKPLQVIFRKQTDKPKSPCELEPSAPDDLNDLCMGLLSIDQQKRPTAADVLRCIGFEELVDSLKSPDRVGAGQTLELVGREGHLRGLQSSFRQVTHGKTKTLFVHGKSGMGKSVLIQKFLSEIQERDQAVVLSGRCYEQESVPFKALDNLIDSLADHLTSLTDADVRAATPDDFLPLIRLFPVLGQIPGASDLGRPSIENVDQQELRQRATNALREMLRRLGDKKPLVLHIDDLQWGDEDSADLLADLVRPPHSPRVLVLGSYRTENRSTSLCLKAIDKAYSTGQHRPHREEIAVDSLQQEDAKRLALKLLGRDDKKGQVLADKIARESGGWPFFVWELAQHVQDTSDIGDQTLELDEVIWTRVGRLPEPTRRLLELVAVTGRPIPAAEAYHAIGAMDKGQSFLAQLRTRNFVRTTGSDEDETVIETYHDRIRESVVDHLDDSTVKRHCVNLAETIEEVSGINVEDLHAQIAKTSEFEQPATRYELQKHQWQRVFDLAYFFDAGGAHERAFPFALCAAEQARQQDAYEVAEQQFRIALRGTENVSSALRFRVHEGLGDVLVVRGKYDAANDQYKAARSHTTTNLVLARLDGKLGESAFKKGDMGVAREYLEQALAVVGEPPPSRLMVIPSLLKQAIIQVLHTKFPARFVGRNKQDSPQGRLDLFRARIYTTLTQVHWFTSGMNLCLLAHLRHMNLSERYPAGQLLGRAYAFHAIVMTALPMAERGIRYAERAYQISIDQGDLWGQGKARSFHTFSCIVLARFQEGIRTGTQAIELLEQAGDVWEANMARMIVSVPRYHLGDLKNAYLDAKKAYEIGSETGDYSAVCISLVFWAPCAPHLLPTGAIEKEMERERGDPLGRLAVVLARGLELLLREDNPEEAARVFQQSQDMAAEKGIRNVCIFAGVPWKATSLRIVAERTPDGAARRHAIKAAKRQVGKALKLTKSYKAFRPHVLREAGIIASMEGKEVLARRYFAESLQVAAEHEARYDHARTTLAQAEAGIKFGWPDAQERAVTARKLVAQFEDVGTE
ncbi:MAG: protein kinase [Planctomycetales bacterium]|nr:protein kinase [Planctomycetales bacterium]